MLLVSLSLFVSFSLYWQLIRRISPALREGPSLGAFPGGLYVLNVPLGLIPVDCFCLFFLIVSGRIVGLMLPPNTQKALAAEGLGFRGYHCVVSLLQEDFRV